MLKPALAIPLALSAALLAGCNSSVRPPGDAGVCYHVVQGKEGKIRFNELVRNMPNLENCAARLEGLRLKFLGLGGNREQLVGAYQANFLFLDRTGVSSATTLTGARYTALVRTGDGRLAIPGAMPAAR